MVKLKDILDKILYMASSYSRNAGKDLWSKQLISNISSKKIDNIYHIYGKAVEDKSGNFYSCHIKIDFNTKTVNGCTCSCPEFIEFSKHKKNYVCKHIVATAFTFYEVGKRKIVKKVDTLNKPQKKIMLNVDINIKEIKQGEERVYNLQFRIGEKTTYLISSIEEFLSFREQKRSLRINGDFMYNPYIHVFSKKDDELLDYMTKYLKENKFSLDGRLNAKEVYILEDHLGEFLNKIQHDKKIKLNHDYINYLAYVKSEKLPVSFTLKLQEEMLLLTSKKKLPISLNNKCDVFLYDRNLYIPPERQVKNYLPIHKELRENGVVKYKKSLINLEKLLKSLDIITKDITLGEGIQRLVTEILVPHFYLERKNNTMYCVVKINYLGKQVNILNKENEEYVARDKKREELIELNLEKLRFIKKSNEFIFIGNEEEEFEFLRNGIKVLKSIGKVYTNKFFDSISLISEDIIDGIIEEEYGRYYLNFTIDDLSYEELENIYEALRNKKRYYKTKNNKFLDLENESILKLLNVLEMINGDTKFSSQKLEIDENKFLYLEDKIRNNGLSFIKGERILNRITEKLKNREKADVKEVEELQGNLRPYQLIGVNYLKNLSDIGFGGILADEMGLGKTIQAISFLLIEKGKKTVVIAPTSLIYNWKEEFERFAPTLKVAIIHGSITKRKKVFLEYEDYDVIITTYGTLKSDIQWYSDKNFDYCIIDEAQNIKSSKAQVTKLVKSINAHVKIALTGTPMENNLLELWSIFDFIMPGFLGDEKSFKDKFVNGSEIELSELKALINPFILRRLKKDVLNELPEKIEKQYFVQMTSKQSQIYKSYIKEIKKELKLKSKDKITVFSYLTKLRQLCLDPSILIDNYEGGSGKLNIIDDLVNIKIEDGNKILIFSQFTSVLKKLKDKLISNGINHMYLDGSTAAKERLKLVNEFNNNEDIKVFLISLKAGGTGLNLTSANVVIHFDPWWNPAIEDQATDRAHRIGQKNVVEVIKLIAKDTVEEKIIKLQEDKKEIINEILNGENISTNLISKLSDEEILDLFQ